MNQVDLRSVLTAQWLRQTQPLLFSTMHFDRVSLVAQLHPEISDRSERIEDVNKRGRKERGATSKTSVTTIIKNTFALI